ncbi:hypothetical protein JHK87_009599 [Glycine soja]|nr:hypothetical protein JHK87_009599 [Glycine soja]
MSMLSSSLTVKSLVGRTSLRFIVSRTKNIVSVCLSKKCIPSKIVPTKCRTSSQSKLCSIVTEFITSNAATATLLVPLLYHIAGTMHVHPFILIIPGGIATEFAFWLPTSTPSNVVGFATGHIEIKDMFKVGVPLKVVGIVVLSLLMPSLGELPTISVLVNKCFEKIIWLKGILSF